MPPRSHRPSQNGAQEPSISCTTSNDINGLARSVSFSHQLPERRPMDTESSADEHTAIIQRQRGGKRQYNTTNQARKSSEQLERDTNANQHVASRESTPQVDGSSESRSGERPPQLTWWKNLLDKYGTVELQNKGSVARDHLANERTFLAWLRTSLSFASIGIAVTQLFRLDQTLAQTPHDHPRVQKLRHVGKPLGATFLAVGILVLLIGFHRYFESQHYVMLGKFPAGRGNIALVAFCAGALTVASLVVILSISPGALT